MSLNDFSFQSDVDRTHKAAFGIYDGVTAVRRLARHAVPKKHHFTRDGADLGVGCERVVQSCFENIVNIFHDMDPPDTSVEK